MHDPGPPAVGLVAGQPQHQVFERIAGLGIRGALERRAVEHAREEHDLDLERVGARPAQPPGRQRLHMEALRLGQTTGADRRPREDLPGDQRLVGAALVAPRRLQVARGVEVGRRDDDVRPAVPLQVHAAEHLVAPDGAAPARLRRPRRRRRQPRGVTWLQEHPAVAPGRVGPHRRADQDVREPVAVDVSGGRDGVAEGPCEATRDAEPAGGGGQRRLAEPPDVQLDPRPTAAADHQVADAVPVRVPDEVERGAQAVASAPGDLPVRDRPGTGQGAEEQLRAPGAAAGPRGAEQEVGAAVAVDVAAAGHRPAEPVRAPARGVPGERRPRRAAEVQRDVAGARAAGVVGEVGGEQIVEPVAVDVTGVGHLDVVVAGPSEPGAQVVRPQEGGAGVRAVDPVGVAPGDLQRALPADSEVEVAVPVPVGAGEPQSLVPAPASRVRGRAPGPRRGAAPDAPPGVRLQVALGGSEPVDPFAGHVPEDAQLGAQPSAAAGVAGPVAGRARGTQRAVEGPGRARTGTRGAKEVGRAGQHVAQPVAVDVADHRHRRAQPSVDEAPLVDPGRSALRRPVRVAQVQPQHPVVDGRAELLGRTHHQVGPAVAVDVAARRDRSPELRAIPLALNEPGGGRDEAGPVSEVDPDRAGLCEGPVLQRRADDQVGVRAAVEAARGEGGPELGVLDLPRSRPARRSPEAPAAPPPDADLAHGDAVSGGARSAHREVGEAVRLGVAQGEHGGAQGDVGATPLRAPGRGALGAAGDPVEQLDPPLPRPEPGVAGGADQDLPATVAVDVARAGQRGAEQLPGLGPLDRPGGRRRRAADGAEEQPRSAAVAPGRAIPAGRPDQQVGQAVAVDVPAGGDHHLLPGVGLVRLQAPR